MFLHRHISDVVEKASSTFPVLVLSGPRQIGKTTLLKHQNPGAQYVTFDKEDALAAARDAPEAFLSQLSTPSIIDEVQYDPNLFRYIKMFVDSRKPKKGSFLLTGSQRFQMMAGVDESLAGRAGIIEMLGLSLREIKKEAIREPFIPSKEYLQSRSPKASKIDVWELIYKGDLPEVILDNRMDPSMYYASYVETYLRRDVRDLAHVGDLNKFNRFLEILALSHGQILNKASLSAEVGVASGTIDRWLSVLEASSVIYFLKPFTASSRKRLIKTPKVYFLNSGIAASLCGFASADQIRNSEMAGRFFEGFVISEILKSFLNFTGKIPDLYYYRDSNGKEIDLVIQNQKTLYPVEIKKAEIARPSDIKAFADLDLFAGYSRGIGVVVCAKDLSGAGSAMALPITPDAFAISLAYI